MFNWTDEVIDHVAGLLRIGATGSEIAREIGATRSSVIAKVNRDQKLIDIGFCRQNGPQIAAIKAGRRLEKKKRIISARPLVTQTKQKIQPHNIVNKKASRSLDKLFRGPTVAQPEYNLDALRLTLTELGPRQCKWDVANPNVGEEYLFCGKPTEDLRPWCSHHHKLAFRVSA